MTGLSSRIIRLVIYSLISLSVYILFAYTIERSEFGWLIGSFGVLFVFYVLMLKEVGLSTIHLKWGVATAIIFRLSLLFAIPTLSDDFYRFIWDGNLFVNGINPFLHTPELLIQTGAVPFRAEILYAGLNSPEYYSVYPPICQFVFGIAAEMFGEQLLGNIVIIRLFILAAEMGTIWILKKLLDHFNLNPGYLLIYALNPLVILEITGNLHFEGIMIFFLLFAFYLFLDKRYLWAAVIFALAVNTKLIPLLLVPYLVFSKGWRQSAYFVPILAAGTLALHLPFLDASFIDHFSSSLGLYFQTFEFNAGIYYLVRWAGYQIQGYNIIQTAAPVLATISTLLIIGLAWKYRDRSLKNLPSVYIISVGVYYLFSTTVHPWYVSSLVAFVPLGGLLFPVVWSAVIPLTYAAYMTPAYTENLWLVALEYVIVAGVILIDLYRQNYSIRVNPDTPFLFEKDSDISQS